MEKQVRDDVLAVLEQVQVALNSEDSSKIRELSDHTIHNASIYQDEFSLTCAVVVYALSKIIARCKGDATVCARPISSIKKAIEVIDDEEAFAKALNQTLRAIQSTDNKLNTYVEEVVHKAKVQKGSALARHGISIGRAAELLGISTWDLQGYIGQTTIADQEETRVKIKSRLATARKVFP